MAEVGIAVDDGLDEVNELLAINLDSVPLASASPGTFTKYKERASIHDSVHPFDSEDSLQTSQEEEVHLDCGSDVAGL